MVHAKFMSVYVYIHTHLEGLQLCLWFWTGFLGNLVSVQILIANMSTINKLGGNV